METKLKLVAYLEAHTDNHKTKWLKSRDPELWVSILDYTSFLPEDAKPKQRIWHVLNENTVRPTCPVTGEFVKWQDDRYLTFSSKSAAASSSDVQKTKIKAYKERTGFTCHWKNNPEVKERSRATAAISRAKGLHKPIKRSDTWRQKVYATWDKKYEEQNLADYERYRKEVNKITRRNYRLFREKIETSGLIKSKENHLDHVFSVSEAWRNKVDPEIVGHWTNLRVIPAKENMSKNAKSDKSLDQLYEDYNKNSV